MSLTLGELALYYHSDKGKLNQHKTQGHNYMKVYDRCLSKYQYSPFVLLEIGVRWGDSVNIWQDFFSRVNIIGVDIDPKCKELETQKVRIYICDQADKKALTDIGDKVGKGEISVIIDDGSHKASDIIASLSVLKDYLCKGGFYFIEDMDPNQDKEKVKEYINTLTDMRCAGYVPSEAMNDEELAILVKR